MKYDNDSTFMHTHTFLLAGVRPLGACSCERNTREAQSRRAEPDLSSDEQSYFTDDQGFLADDPDLSADNRGFLADDPGLSACVRGLFEAVAAPDSNRRCSIALFPEGPGSLDLDGVTVDLRQGAAIQLRPGGRFGLSAPAPAPAPASAAPHKPTGWLIEFFICRLGEARPVTGGFPLLPYHQEIVVRPLAALCSIAERLTKAADDRVTKEADNDNELTALRKQAALLELLALLMENQRRFHRPADAAIAVEKTVAYVREHYTEPLTVEQLAAMAGVGRWQFSGQFRRLTGERPLDYINTLRMNRAKELLLLTDDPLREIAHSVGFRDECYFIRRFSRTFGCSPKSYARSRKSAASLPQSPPAASRTQVGLSLQQPHRRDAPARLVVCGSLLGDVLMLGVKPLGAALTVMGRQVVYRDKLAGILDVGVVGEVEAIAALRPDLLLLDKAGTIASRLLAGTTPIVSFARTEDASVRLRAIAALLGAEREANNWIARHEESVRAMWTRLRSRFGTRETATVLVQLGERLFAMSNQGLAATLYHPCGFQPSIGAGKLIAANERFREITADELPDYDGDRLFLLASGDERSQREARLLAESPAWRGLYAFRSGNIHLAEAKWNYDDSLTRERLLPVLPAILASRV